MKLAKATVTLRRQMKLEKPISFALGGSLITEATVHFNTTPLTIHAEDVRLRRLTRIFLFPIAPAGTTLKVNMAYGSIESIKKMNNFASINIRHFGTCTTAGGSAKIANGTAQDYFGIFIGD